MLHKGLTSCGAALLITLGGCATEPAATGAASVSDGKSAAVVGRQKVVVYDKSEQSDQDVRCRSFRPTGSHRNVTRCTTSEQRELEEDAGRRSVEGNQFPVESTFIP